MKWPKTVKYKSATYTGKLRSRMGKQFIEYIIDSYHYTRLRRTGKIELPDGWQDMERTWTAVDIYWIDKYDCTTERERVPLLR